VAGALVLVGTPIGNLDDLSPRAIAALCAADVIACEDTRRTRRLLSAAGVPAPTLVAVHEHNEASMVGALIDRIGRGQRVALVSDAGMPAISDPGERVVQAAVAAGLPVEVVPGPSAAISALVVSGLAADRWCFEGFLPRKGRDRGDRLASIADERRTVVLYEAPHRLATTLADLAAACGSERQVAVVRELTKVFEEVWRGSLSDAAARAASAAPRGEHVVVVEGAPAGSPATDDDVRSRLAHAMADGADRKTAVSEVATTLKVPRRRVYDLALSLPRPEIPPGKPDHAG